MKAWATLLSRPDDYVMGVRTMHRSLRDVGSAHPLLVMVTAAVGQDVRDLLEADGCLVREVEPLSPAAGTGQNYLFDHFSEVWSKLAVWGLTDHERIVLVDADMLATQDMDELFDIPLPPSGIAACQTCRCNPEHNPAYPADWVPANCRYTYWPGETPAGFEPYFNSGLVVLEPSSATYAELQSTLAGITDLAAYPFPEQDLLNDVFRGRWADLPYTYNALKTLSRQHPDVWSLADVQNIHYLLTKPWSRTPDPAYGDLDALWTATYRRL